MKNVHILFVLLLFSLSSKAQQITQLHLDHSIVATRATKEIIRIRGPQFSQEGSFLQADSADFNEVLNTFDAYGHVIINQPNGTIIYSDLLNYNGNTRVAILTNNVKMIDPQGAVLTTNLLTYNMATKIGTYVNGGKIVNQGDVLTSRNGYYFDSTRDAYFRHDVVITTKDAIVKADTMRYNSGTRVSYFYGPTNIYGKEDTLYTAFGEYNTVTRQAYGFKNNLYKQGTKFLKGDSIFYDDIKGFGRANRNVVFTDTGSQKIMLFGQQGLFNRIDTSATLTKDPYVIFLTEDSLKVDSVYLTADTLFTKLMPKRQLKTLNLAPLITAADKAGPEESDEDRIKALKLTKAAIAKKAPLPVPEKKPKKKKKKDKNAPSEPILVVDSASTVTNLDSIKAPIILKRPKTKTQLADSVKRDSIMRDSIKLSLDTTRARIVQAYRHVKIFKTDLQSVSDSVFYSYQDSVIRNYGHPLVWSQGSQMSADTIYMQLKNQKLDKLLLQRNGFITNAMKDSVNFNQVKGRTMTGFFVENKLKRIYVNGSAESLYFDMDSTGYKSVNHSEGSLIRISFDNNEVSETAEIRLQNSTYTPYKQVKERQLKGFSWKPEERPKSKEEIIPSLRKTPVKKPAPVPKKTNVPVGKPVADKRSPKPAVKSSKP